MGKKNVGMKIACENRKARHDFFIHETYETGLALQGTEVKSLRAGRANLKDSYAVIKDGEIFVENMHISPYEKGNIFNRDPNRSRRLLMHRREISKLYGLVQQQGVALIPLEMYFSGSRVKVKVGLCRGKKLYDKRDDMAKRAAERDIERSLKERNR